MNELHKYKDVMQYVISNSASFKSVQGSNKVIEPKLNVPFEITEL